MWTRPGANRTTLAWPTGVLQHTHNTHRQHRPPLRSRKYHLQAGEGKLHRVHFLTFFDEGQLFMWKVFGDKLALAINKIKCLEFYGKNASKYLSAVGLMLK